MRGTAVAAAIAPRACRRKPHVRRHLRAPIVLLSCLTVTLALWPAGAHAQPRRLVRGSVLFVGGPVYDPFFGPYPWYPAPYPYGWYPVAYAQTADVRFLVTPKEAAVYVDSFYAGIVDDFNGFFQRLSFPPGEHEIVLYLPGYRTVRQRLYLTPGSTIKLRYTMEKLLPGESSEPPPSAPPPPSGTPPPGRFPPPAPGTAARATAFGTLAIRVQPPDAEVLIDGEPWRSPESGERLMVHVGEGTHHVEIRKAGYRRFITDVQVRRGDTTPLNVSLSPERQ